MLSLVVDFVVEQLNWRQKLPCQGREPAAEIDELFFLLMLVMPLHQGVGLTWEPYPQGEGERHQSHHLLWKEDKNLSLPISMFLLINNLYSYNSLKCWLLILNYLVVT